MDPILLVAALAAASWIYLIVFRGGFWRIERHLPHAAPTDLPGVVAVIPARNEADHVGCTVRSLLRQDYPGSLRVVVVDDQSSDGTAEVARQAAAALGLDDRLTVAAGRPLPAGWSGKVWAQDQGLEIAESIAPDATFVLLTDADIEHAPNQLTQLVARAEAERLDLVSLMVRLSCAAWVERLLIPAFIFFFRKLYPFAWINRHDRPEAGAAGGCMLVRRTMLQRIGGIAAIRNRLIDDCSLAAAIKAQGGRIWLGLAEETRSLRPYEMAGEVWRMIARTAYTQLERSPVNLAGCVVGMSLAYLAPPALALSAQGTPAGWLGLAAWIAMSLAYVPVLRYYRQPIVLAIALPAVALFYLCATLDSARRHRVGRGGEWKGRVQARSRA